MATVKEAHDRLSRSNRWLNAWTSVLERVVRIIASSKLSVSLDEAWRQDAVARIEGDRIFLNVGFMKNLANGKTTLAHKVATLKGLIYHESAHWLYTPDDGYVRDLYRNVDPKLRYLKGNTYKVSRADLHFLVNVMEDQRIETLFSRSYPAARAYFRLNALNLIANGRNPNSPMVFLLLAERRFVDHRVRVASKSAFDAKFGVNASAQWEVIVQKWCKVNFLDRNTRTNEAADVLVEAFLLLHKIDPNGQGKQDLPNPAGSWVGEQETTDLSRRTNKSPSKAQQEAEDAFEGDPGEDDRYQPESESEEAGGKGDGEAEDAEDAEAESGEGDGEGADGESEGADDGDGTGEDEGDEGDDSSGKSKDEGGDIPGTGIGQGRRENAEGTEQLDDAVREALEDALSEVVESSEELIESIKTVAKTKKTPAYGRVPIKSKHNVKAKSESIQAAKVISRKLSKIREELEPEMEHRQSAGRVNLRRYQNRPPWATDFFDAMSSDDTDDGGVEVVGLIDLSGSMHMETSAASQVAWTLQEGFGAAPGSNCTIFAFDEGSYIVYDTADTPSRNAVKALPSMGGTDPSEALLNAYNIFANSTKKSKVLVVFTDGGWGAIETASWSSDFGIDSYEEIFAELHKLGVVSAVFGINNAVLYHGLHGAKYGQDLGSLIDLPTVAADLVTKVVKDLVKKNKRAKTPT